MHDLTEYEDREVCRIQREVERWLAFKKPGEYLPSDKNRQLLTEYLEEHDLDVTATNLEKAHYALLSADPCLLDEDPAGGLNFGSIGQRDPSKKHDRVIRKDIRNMSAEEFATAIASSKSFVRKSTAPHSNFEVPTSQTRLARFRTRIESNFTRK